MELRIFAALCALLCNVTIAAAASPLDLDFATAPSARLWTPRVEGSGPSLALVNGRLELAFPADASNDPATGAFAAGYDSRCRLRGDFDVTLEYLLLDWPISNGIRNGIVVGGTWSSGAVERTSFGTDADYPGTPREVYLTHMADGVNGIVETGDMAGTLRLVRSGTTLTGLRATPEGWAEIHAGAVAHDDLSVTLQSWSHDYAFTDRAARLAFTGFRVRAGAVICGGRLLVSIDVKPESTANPVNLASQGQLPVAILSSPSFDATQVDPATVTVAGAPVARLPGDRLKATVVDVNQDGRLDLLVHVETQRLVLQAGSADLEVLGRTFAGVELVGYDKVTLVP